MRAALVHLRRREGLTQEQLANRMGITQQAVHKFERYDSDPKLSTIRRYANAVGALIKYDVTPDLGQSVRLAATSPWAAADSTSTIVQIERQQDSKSTPSGSWSETLSDTKPWAV